MQKEFIASIVFRIEENLPRIAKCLNELSEEQVWLRPNTQLNSVGNLILHLCGNIRQYAISSLGQQADHRIRDEEFSTVAGYNKTELYQKLSDTVAEAMQITKDCRVEDLLQIRSVQGFSLSGISILIHVCEHFSYHTGQIAFWTKLLTDKDLGFYAGLNLNIK